MTEEKALLGYQIRNGWVFPVRDGQLFHMIPYDSELEAFEALRRGQDRDLLEAQRRALAAQYDVEKLEIDLEEARVKARDTKAANQAAVNTRQKVIAKINGLIDAAKKADVELALPLDFDRS